MRPGDRVALRRPSEILRTLDRDSCLDGLPFMPEMLGYFGNEFRVSAQVGRACDTISYTGVRRLRDTVLLDDLRCTGSGHAGCGAECRLYWKEAWLTRKPVTEWDASEDRALAELRSRAEASVHQPTSTPDAVRFRCQATELVRASDPVSWYDPASFLRELTSGNVGLLRFIRVMFRVVGTRYGRVPAHPFTQEELAAPKESVPPKTGELRRGDRVRIRPKREILQTLGPTGKSRGLWFDREMVPFCGHESRVRAKVERFIDETDGRLIELQSDCYILEGVACGGDLSDKRWFCPRAIYPWWRENWLERVEEQRQDHTRMGVAD